MFLVTYLCDSNIITEEPRGQKRSLEQNTDPVVVLNRSDKYSRAFDERNPLEKPDSKKEP